MAIEFFFTLDYENGNSGKLEQVLSISCMWDGKIRLTTIEDFPDLNIGLLSVAFLDSRLEKFLHASQRAGEAKQGLRAVERDVLKELGFIIDDILSVMCSECLPQKLIIVPHESLHKVQFAAIPLSQETVARLGHKLGKNTPENSKTTTHIKKHDADETFAIHTRNKHKNSERHSNSVHKKASHISMSRRSLFANGISASCAGFSTISILLFKCSSS